jgi:hypothetical protein
MPVEPELLVKLIPDDDEASYIDNSPFWHPVSQIENYDEKKVSLIPLLSIFNFLSYSKPNSNK